MSNTPTTLCVMTARTIKVPRVPNFLLTEGDDVGDKISIASLSSEDLDRVVELWGAALHEHARALRVKPTPTDPSS